MHFALNQMTTPSLSYEGFLDLAASLGCCGVEVRNDLKQPLFDGMDPVEAGKLARSKGLRIVGLSQVYPFNSWSPEIEAEVAALIATAKACGAETISLIPRNDNTRNAEGEWQANLRTALREIKPMLKAADMVALVEPLGFQRSSLRSKAETVAAIRELDATDVFKIVHDTFHHYLAEGGEFFPESTGIIHISGVVDRALALNEIEDEHRVLVDADDRLGNIAQIRQMLSSGYEGPISIEAFSPLTHALSDPGPALRACMDHIARGLA